MIHDTHAGHTLHNQPSMMTIKRKLLSFIILSSCLWTKKPSLIYINLFINIYVANIRQIHAGFHLIAIGGAKGFALECLMDPRIPWHVCWKEFRSEAVM